MPDVVSWQQRSDEGTAMLLGMFDHAPTWTRPDGTTATVRGHRRWFGTDERELINAYGEQGCEVICDLASFPADQTVDKFDVFEVGGQSFTVQAVRRQHGFGNVPTMARAFCTGG